MTLALNPWPLYQDSYDPLVPVDHLDLKAYSGIWYEIARLPQPFETDCYCVTASYTLNPNSTVTVVNICIQGSPSGDVSSIQRIATAMDPINGTVTSGKLSVDFFHGHPGFYYVIALDKGYKYALVGSPDRTGLWILSRTPGFNDEIYQELVEEAKKAEFDLDQFTKTYQSDDCKRTAGNGFLNNYFRHF